MNYFLKTIPSPLILNAILFTSSLLLSFFEPFFIIATPIFAYFLYDEYRRFKPLYVFTLREKTLVVKSNDEQKNKENYSYWLPSSGLYDEVNIAHAGFDSGYLFKQLDTQVIKMNHYIRGNFSNDRVETLHLTAQMTGRAVFKCPRLKKVFVSLKNTSGISFEGCGNLEQAIFRGDVRVVAGTTLHNCKKLRSVTFESANMKVGASAFMGCLDLKSIEFIGKVELAGSSLAPSLENVVFASRPRSAGTELTNDQIIQCLFPNSDSDVNVSNDGLVFTCHRSP